MGHAKHRSTPTHEQLRVWRNYIETANELQRLLEARFQNESAMSSGDYQVLLALSEAPGRTVRSSELASLIGWERSRLSHHLGRMEKRGLIARASCPEVAHGVDVTITDAGLDTFRSGSVHHLRAVRELFVDALSDQQLTEVDAVAASLRVHLGTRQ
ncbi:MarR family transcriptional regulator [Microbacterium mangrovi]|uniref:MarR family transcriptional regulator n=1 Tax=Microbacterium mangrovi TaxID=1348253 RepID=A0A0B2ABJ5_9MICO|nr:MarR family winged helix-turn-helix transcriptional regulator [Microbacterium mangrovi]KHK99138.1 MarR family transcriptional regulator [Microbacterium mangrovi]